MLHLDDLEHYKWDFESISPRKSYPYEKYWLAQHCLWGGVEAKTIPKNRFMLHKNNISISSVQDCQWGGVNRKWVFFFTEMNPQIKAWNRSNQTHIFTASLSSKNINKPNKVGLISFSEKCKPIIQKYTQNSKIYTLTYYEGVRGKRKENKKDGQ